MGLSNNIQVQVLFDVEKIGKSARKTASSFLTTEINTSLLYINVRHLYEVWGLSHDNYI